MQHRATAVAVAGDTRRSFRRGFHAARKLDTATTSVRSAGHQQIRPEYADLIERGLEVQRARSRRTKLSLDRLTLVGADVVSLGTLVALTMSLKVGLAAAAAMLVWQIRGLYSRRFALSVLDDLPSIALGAVTALIVLAVPPWPGPAANAATTLGLFCVAVIGRAVSYRVILRLRSSGRIRYPAVVLGAGETALSLVRRIQDHPETGLRPVGFLDQSPITDDLPAPLLGEVEDIIRVVCRDDISDVIVAYGGVSSADLVEVLRRCDRLAVEIHVVPRLFEMHGLGVGTDQIWGVPLTRVRRRTVGGLSWRLKRVLDVLLSGVSLLLLSPVLVAVALAVRAELGPGVLFRQLRIGLDGHAFTVRKFRSMKHLPAGADSPWSVSGDDRLGKVGRFIRRYSLDELPQLFDVFVGNMSLVGPRPERPEYVERFCEEVPRYWTRHRVPAGLTGLAAVHGLRGDTSIADRAYFDNLYIENWSLWLDLKIMARTVLAVARGTGG